MSNAAVQRSPLDHLLVRASARASAQRLAVRLRVRRLAERERSSVCDRMAGTIVKRSPRVRQQYPTVVFNFRPVRSPAGKDSERAPRPVEHDLVNVSGALRANYSVRSAAGPIPYAFFPTCTIPLQPTATSRRRLQPLRVGLQPKRSRRAGTETWEDWPHSYGRHDGCPAPGTFTALIRLGKEKALAFATSSEVLRSGRAIKPPV